MTIIYIYLLLSLALIAARYIDQNGVELSLSEKVFSLVFLLACSPIVVALNLLLKRVYSKTINGE